MKFFNKKLNTNDSNLKDNFINPKILEVNLIKDEVGVEFKWNKHLISLGVAILVAALLVAEIYYGLDWWQKQEEQKSLAITDEYQNVNRQVRNIDANAKDFTIFKDKLALTKKMADSHVYFTSFFDWLEKNTLNSVTYNSFAGDLSGNYSLSSNAKTFADISWQVKAFHDNKLVNSVSVDSGAAAKIDDKSLTKPAEPTVNFSMSLKVKPEIFFHQAGE